MNKNNVYVLIHSPLVGPLTWKLVADQMRQRDMEVIVPTLVDAPDFERTLLETARRIRFAGTRSISSKTHLSHWLLIAAQDLCSQPYEKHFPILSMPMYSWMQASHAMMQHDLAYEVRRFRLGKAIPGIS